MKNPQFSIIVPAHNSAAFLGRALGSIRRQTVSNYELIVVADACTDNTAEVAEWYTDTIIETKFGMDGLARNAGLDAAAGEWILFMDDDDWWMHNYVLEEIRKAIRPDVDMLVFDFIWNQCCYYRNTDQLMNIAVWSKAFRRELIGETRFPAIPFTSDKPFMDEILKKRPTVHAMNELMYFYNYMREGSQTEIDRRKKDV